MTGGSAHRWAENPHHKKFKHRGPSNSGLPNSFKVRAEP